MGSTSLAHLSQREMEELETKVAKSAVAGHDIDASMLAIRVKDYVEALKSQGFSEDNAIKLVGVTIGYLLR